MKNLTEQEMKQTNGGNVPMAFYMDDDVIRCNGEIMGPWCIIVGRTLLGLGKEIIRAACL